MIILKKKYRVTVLSPVHIGSLKSWIRDIHFASHDAHTKIHQTADISNSHDSSLEFVINDAPTPEEPPTVIEFPGKIYGSHISQYARNGWGNPYIPGNTINGFFHTALQCNVQSTDAQNSQNSIFTHIDRKGSIKVLFSDVEFTPNSLEISDIKILNLSTDQSYGWKKFGQNGRNLPAPQMATSDYVETLKAGEYSIGYITVRLAINDEKVSSASFSDLESVCNNFATSIIDNECSFYNQCSMKEGYSFYVGLREKLKSLGSGFFACLGWGVGWRALVGALHNSTEISRLRRQHNLGKMDSPCPTCGSSLKTDRFKPNNFFCMKCKKTVLMHDVVMQLFPIFPKTRKFVVSENRPIAPLGWLRFEESPDFEAIRNPDNHLIELRVREKKSRIERTPFLTPEEYPDGISQTKHFKKKIRIAERGSFPTEFNVFFNKIAQLDFILTISPDTDICDIDIMRVIPTDNVDEILFDLSLHEKGIRLLIKTGAQNQEQKNFVINRLWEIVNDFAQNE